MNAAPSTLARPAARQTFAQWCAALSEYLPPAWIRANAFALLALHRDTACQGCTVAIAATYARAFMGAPSL